MPVLFKVILFACHETKMTKGRSPSLSKREYWNSMVIYLQICIQIYNFI